jgi:hypothetical protein
MVKIATVKINENGGSTSECRCVWFSRQTSPRLALTEVDIQLVLRFLASLPFVLATFMLAGGGEQG